MSVTTNAYLAWTAAVVTAVVMGVRLPVVAVTATALGGPEVRMTSLRHDSRCPQESLAFYREHRDRLGRITHAVVTVPTSRAELFYTLVLRDEAGGQLLLSGPVGDDEDEVRATLLRVVREAGFAEEPADAIRTHAAVRMRRGSDGATWLESASGPRWQFPRRLPTEPARAALRAFARGHGIRIVDLADVLSVERALVDSAMSARWLAWDAADRLAIALRTHPQQLWPQWFGARSGDAGPTRVDSAANSTAPDGVPA